MEFFEQVDGGITAALGFCAAGVEAAIKYENRKDVALLVSKTPCSVGAVFTSNLVAAAPVLLDRQRLGKRQAAQAIIMNSGCANACTGAQGLSDAEAVTAAMSKVLGIDEDLVLVSSTGVIGALLPVERMIDGGTKAFVALSPSGGNDAAHAIMTTDTVDKQYAVKFEIFGKTVTIGGMCKGAGMIEPNMATMLAFVSTDAKIGSALLQKMVKKVADVSFNRCIVDGDQSTNDTLIVLANGVSGIDEITENSAEAAIFEKALRQVCVELSRKIVMDGEGVSKFVTVAVRGAETDSDAHLAARAIGRSPLVKTSWYGIDPNWGRVICAVGYSGAKTDATLVRIFYGDVCAYDRGVVADDATLEKMKTLMKSREFTVTVDLGLGNGSDTVYTCDLTHRYIEINAEYTT